MQGDVSTADAVWRWLSACQKCGKPHEYREVGYSQRSWADPDDGHAYEHRGAPDLNAWQLSLLWAQWKAETS